MEDLSPSRRTCSGPVKVLLVDLPSDQFNSVRVASTCVLWCFWMYYCTTTLSSSMQARLPTHGDPHSHQGKLHRVDSMLRKTLGDAHGKMCFTRLCKTDIRLQFLCASETLVMCLDVLPAFRRNPNMRGVGRDYFV